MPSMSGYGGASHIWYSPILPWRSRYVRERSPERCAKVRRRAERMCQRASFSLSSNDICLNRSVDTPLICVVQNNHGFWCFALDLTIVDHFNWSLSFVVLLFFSLSFFLVWKHLLVYYMARFLFFLVVSSSSSCSSFYIFNLIEMWDDHRIHWNIFQSRATDWKEWNNRIGLNWSVERCEEFVLKITITLHQHCPLN